MIKLSTAIKAELDSVVALIAVTTNIQRVRKRQDMTDTGVYFQSRTEDNPRVDSDKVKLSEVTIFCVSDSATDCLTMTEALDSLYSGKGESGTFLDFSNTEVHCITTKRISIEDAVWDQDLQRFVGIFTMEAEWSYK